MSDPLCLHVRFSVRHRMPTRPVSAWVAFVAEVWGSSFGRHIHCDQGCAVDDFLVVELEERDILSGTLIRRHYATSTLGF